MALEQTLNDTLTKAIKEKDTRVSDVVRMIKSKIGERRTAKGFSGTVDDALVLDVIGAYRKQLQKALAEFEKVGERGAAHVAAAALRDRVLRALPAEGHGRGGAAHARRASAWTPSRSPTPSKWAGWSATS